MTITEGSSIMRLGLRTRAINGLLNCRHGEIRDVGLLIYAIKTSTRREFMRSIPFNYGDKSHDEVLRALRGAGFEAEHKLNVHAAREALVWRDDHPSWTSGPFEVKTQMAVDQHGKSLHRLMARRADLNETFREYRPTGSKR